MGNTTTVIDIFWDDFTPEKKEEIRKVYAEHGIDVVGDMNYDVFPITQITIYDEETE